MIRAGVLMLLAAAALLHAASAPGTTVCTANPCTVRAASPGNGDAHDGLVVVGAQGANHALVVDDQHDVPIVWTNPDSVSATVEVCALAADLSRRACISPGTWDAAAGRYAGPGFVVLWACGRCAPVRLMPRDVAWIHARGG